MESQMRNLFADLHEMPGIENNLEGIARPGTLKEVAPATKPAVSTEEMFAHDDNMGNPDDFERPPATPNGSAEANGDADVSSGDGKGRRKRKQSSEKNALDVRRSSRHDKDLQKILSKPNQKVADLDQTNILPSLRRSNRANKGVSKEVFDPSHIPSPKYRSTVGAQQQRNNNDSSDEEPPHVGKAESDSPKNPGEKPRVPKKAEKNKEEKKKGEKEQQDDDEDDDEDSESEDDGYNDPNRLWCICKKPHNGRFMISCDLCEEWFHGDCVGITVQKGKQMEKKGEEYVCPACMKSKGKKSKTDKTTEKHPPKYKSGVRLKGYAHEKDAKHPKKGEHTKHAKRRKSHEAPEAASRRHSQSGSVKGAPPTKRRKCIVSTCGNEAQADSVYCSNVCILRHAKESLGEIAKSKKDLKGKPPPDTRQETKEERILRKIREAATKGKVAVYCHKTGKIFSNNSAPLKEELESFLKKNPTFRQLRLKKHKHDSASKEKPQQESQRRKSLEKDNHKPTNVYSQDPDYKPAEVKPSNPYKPQSLNSSRDEHHHKPKKHKIDRQESSNDHKKAKLKKLAEQERRHSAEKAQKAAQTKRDHRSMSDDKTDSRKDLTPQKEKEVRRNVQKTLHGILQNRSNNSEDLKMHPDSISRLVNKIEDSLYKLFGGVSAKYKNRYRSITFNLKDDKNEGLWRKVILGEVTSSSLVKMTAEEMASKELAQWRKHELTQELEMIHELEVAKRNIRPVSKITHKGEIAINEDLTDLTESHLDAAHEVGPSIAPQRIRRISANQPDSLLDSMTLPSDTTLEHNSHLFDMNCRICTGQMKEEDAQLEDAGQKAVKRSTSIILSNEAQTTAEKEHSDEEILKKITAFNKKQEKFIVIPPQKESVEEEEGEKSIEPVSPEEDIISKIEEKLAKVEKSPEKEPENENAKDPSSYMTSKLSREHFLWTGVISMPELSSFHTNAYTVSGNTKGLVSTIPSKLVLDGRIHPTVVWDYLAKVSTFPNKEVCVIQFRASSEDDRVGYVSMLSYFSSRRRFGVVSNQNTQVIKDIYLVPLLETESVPRQLLPFKGPGIPPQHPSMLLGVIVRCIQEPQRRKSSPETDFSSSKHEEKHKKHKRDDIANTTKISLLDRNRLLTPPMPHFTQKDPDSPKNNNPPEDEEEYNPETADFVDLDVDDLPEGSQSNTAAAEEDEEAYDPEKLVFEDAEDEDDAPYDPELEAERLETTELKALQEKQAQLERMKHELEMKKAELAKEEMSLQQQAPPPPPPKVVSQLRADPRIAARMKNQKNTPGNNTANTTPPAPETPLQTIFSVLNLDRSKNT